jgi:DNA-directed RNA polymerase specialized sigma24 family protein
MTKKKRPRKIEHLYDEAFFERLRQRDESTWQRLKTDYSTELRKAICSTILRETGLEPEKHLYLVDEVEQRMWITAYQSIRRENFRDTRHLIGWLYNTQVNHIRNLRRHRQDLPLLDGAMEYLPDQSQPNPEEALIAAEEAQEREYLLMQFYAAVTHVIGETPDAQHQQILTRCLIFDEAAEAVARDTSIPVKQVRELVRNAKSSALRHISYARDLFGQALRSKVKREKRS